MTFVDVLYPAEKRRRFLWLGFAAGVLAGSLLVALSARVAIPLPFSPVPITGQTFGVLLVGACLGSRRGAASLLLYLAEGAMGLPVFAEGKAGVAWLFGPTGGYLFGFVAAAFVVGRLCELGWDRRLGTAAIVFLAGNAVIYWIALPWLACFVGTGRVLTAGLWPFLPGDVLKVILATILLPCGWKLVGRQ